MATLTPSAATFEFDPAHGTELDVYLPPRDAHQHDDTPAVQERPAVVYFHGGGMTSGGKVDLLFPDWLPSACLPPRSRPR